MFATNHETLSQAERLALKDRHDLWAVLRKMHQGDYSQPATRAEVVKLLPLGRAVDQTDDAQPLRLAA